MKVRVCPSCGKHNLENTFNCIDCGETLSVDTLIDIESTNSETGTRNDPVETRNNQLPQNNEESKIIIACENCGQRLRIPLRRKNLHVACPTCHHEFNYEFVEATLVNEPSEKKPPAPPQSKNSYVNAPNSNPQPNEFERVRCPNCGGYKVTQAAIGGQVLDFILLSMTFGLWLIVMLLRGPHEAKPGDKLHCELCGHEWILK